MPIDTAQKRRSASGIPFLPLGVSVTPDALKPVAWRQDAGWGYSGIQPGVTTTVHPPICFTSISITPNISITSVEITPSVTGTVSIDKCNSTC